MGEDDDLEHSTEKQEERCTTTVGFEFYRGLKNSAVTFQAAVRQPAMTNSINGRARPSVGTPSMTTQSFGLTLDEIRTTKPEESA
jgi:hypothetical protein